MILYFSGTGNSKFVAEELRRVIGGEALPLNHFMREGGYPALEAGSQLVVVTPIYAGRIPKVVSAYLASMPVPKGIRTYFVAP